MRNASRASQIQQIALFYNPSAKANAGKWDVLLGACKIQDMMFKVEELLRAIQATSDLKYHTCTGRHRLNKKDHGDSNK